MTKPENDLEIKREGEERKLHRSAKVHNILEMWQGSTNLCATQKECYAKYKQLTAIEYISDTDVILNASWSNFEYDGVTACKLSERSPLPPVLSVKDLPWGQTEVLNPHPIKRIDPNSAESDQYSAPETISDSEYWLDWNADLDNPNKT